MRKIIFFIVFLMSTASFSQEKEITVSVNKNVEFAALLSWLVYFGESYENGTNELAWKNQKYQIQVYEKFKKFKDDPLLDTFKKVDENEGLSSYIWLFGQLEDFPKAELTKQVNTDDYISVDDDLPIEDRKIMTEKVLSDLNEFYEKIAFDDFLNENADLYNRIINEVQSNLPDRNFLVEMQSFYNQYDKDVFILNPSLLIPSGMGFGPTLNNKIYNFFGSYGGIDLEKDITNFDNRDAILTLATHEFGHSFVNHIVDKVDDNAIEESSFLFEPIRASMRNQGYISWRISLYEHFVRAGEIIIAANLGNAKGSDNLYSLHIVKNDFIYLPIILKHLNYYNANKDKISYQQSVENAILEIKDYR